MPSPLKWVLQVLNMCICLWLLLFVYVALAVFPDMSLYLGVKFRMPLLPLLDPSQEVRAWSSIGAHLEVGFSQLSGGPKGPWLRASRGSHPSIPTSLTLSSHPHSFVIFLMQLLVFPPSPGSTLSCAGHVLHSHSQEDGPGRTEMQKTVSFLSLPVQGPPGY
jgi:hypothetical protein